MADGFARQHSPYVVAAGRGLLPSGSFSLGLCKDDGAPHREQQRAAMHVAAVCSTQTDVRTRPRKACGCQQTGFLLCLRASWRARRRNAQGCRVASFDCAQRRWFRLTRSHRPAGDVASDGACYPTSLCMQVLVMVGARPSASFGRLQLACRHGSKVARKGQSAAPHEASSSKKRGLLAIARRFGSKKRGSQPPCLALSTAELWLLSNVMDTRSSYEVELKECVVN